MASFTRITGLIALLILAVLPAYAMGSKDAAAPPAPAATANGVLPDRVLGDAAATVTVEEFISLTCPHCAEFYNTTLPELEKRYVDNGKVKFILRDFPLDGAGLKAATIARCMPAEQYYPFISILYKNQTSWALLPTPQNPMTPEQQIMQYARLGGLSEDKAKACLQDTKLQDAIVAERTDAAQKYNVQATPTFVINNGAEKISGAQGVDAFAAVFDRLLAAKK